MSDADRDSDDRTRVVGAAPSSPPVDDGATVIASMPGSATVVTGSRNDSEEIDQAGVLPAGTRLTEFEITSLVGQGGFGAVYQAWDHSLERAVALKEYLPASLSTRKSDGTVVPLSERTRETFDLGMRSFMNEARLLAQFDHPSLVKVYRFWQERGTAYMAMPFYRGKTLRQTLETMPGGADEAWLLRIMDGVTQALAVMHGANCYHRDIAPDNIILLEGSGLPVVLDFGAARHVISDKTQAITVILKPGYAPIEQYAEMPGMSQGAWTDVYALAAVMHVAVAGRAPPPSVARLVNDSYEPLAGNEALRGRYSQRLLGAIDAGLGVRPESRPQSIQQLRAALGLDGASSAPVRDRVRETADADSDRTVLIQPAGAASRTLAAPAPPAPTPGAGRAMKLGLAAVLLITIAGGAWWWIRGDTNKPVDVAAPAVNPPAIAPTPPPAEPPTAVAPPAPTVPAAIKPVTPAESLDALANGATPGFQVTATPRKPEVTIGQDKLAFDVRSNRDGFVYIFLLSSGNELFLLFPNLLDKYNKITPGAPLALPRASWPMASGGPPGTNLFAVLVSEHERDFSQAGMQNDGVFPRFALPALAALEAARGTGPAPLLGRAVCPQNAPCKDVYGVGRFSIVEK